MIQTQEMRRSEQVKNPSLPVSVPGQVGWLFDSDIAQSLIQSGAKVRVKVCHSENQGTLFHPHQAEITDVTRIIFSDPSKGISPGRRLAEIKVSVVTTGESDEAFEAIHLTVFGPHRSLFHRERLFDGSVSSRREAISILNEHLKKGS